MWPWFVANSCYPGRTPAFLGSGTICVHNILFRRGPTPTLRPPRTPGGLGLTVHRRGRRGRLSSKSAPGLGTSLRNGPPGCGFERKSGSTGVLRRDDPAAAASPKPPQLLGRSNSTWPQPPTANPSFIGLTSRLGPLPARCSLVTGAPHGSGRAGWPGPPSGAGAGARVPCGHPLACPGCRWLWGRDPACWGRCRGTTSMTWWPRASLAGHRCLRGGVWPPVGLACGVRGGSGALADGS